MCMDYLPSLPLVFGRGLCALSASHTPAAPSSRAPPTVGVARRWLADRRARGERPAVDSTHWHDINYITVVRRVVDCRNGFWVHTIWNGGTWMGSTASRSRHGNGYGGACGTGQLPLIELNCSWEKPQWSRPQDPYTHSRSFHLYRRMQKAPPNRWWNASWKLMNNPWGHAPVNFPPSGPLLRPGNAVAA